MSVDYGDSSDRDTAPSTGEIAELLDTDPIDLVRLVGAIEPDTAGELIERTFSDPEHEDAVAAWLDGGEIDAGRGGRPQGDEVEDAPGPGKVADRLGVDRRRLLQFVKFHPGPTASNVLGWARAGPEHETVVAAWLGSRRTERPDFSGADPIARDDARRGRSVR